MNYEDINPKVIPEPFDMHSSDLLIMHLNGGNTSD